LELDDPTELIRTGYGTRVPMGWELDFYATSPSRWLLTGANPVEISGAYTQAGDLSGLLLDGDGAHAASGPAQRWHWWGTEPLTSAGITTAGPGDRSTQAEELHLPLSHGPVIVERTSTTVLIRAADALGA
jgi:hypothetical protein